MSSNNHEEFNLIHGGQLNNQVKKYGIDLEDWLDLSTGISPYSYPLENIPSYTWHRLPEISQSFLDAVNQYYGSSSFIACAGSQAAIQAIPQLWKQVATQSSSIWLPKVGYKEHQKHWLYNGYSIAHYSELPSNELLEENSVVVVINPNNPTGKVYNSKVLLELADYLAKKKGLLIVDEAFIESNLIHSLTKQAKEFENLIVLRSLGKFFGLAGARLGFAFATNNWLTKLKEKLGEWPISGPTLYTAEKALSDKTWQSNQLKKLTIQSRKLNLLLERIFNLSPAGNILFQTILLKDAKRVFELLCKQGVYVRLTDDNKALRFGIPDNAGLIRLEKVLLSLNDDLITSA